MHSGDGHDKLMGFIRDTFPLAAYGLQDVFSGKVLYLKLWTSNSNPKLIGRWYLEHLSKTKGDKYWTIIDSILPEYFPHLDLLPIFKSKCTYAVFMLCILLKSGEINLYINSF